MSASQLSGIQANEPNLLGDGFYNSYTLDLSSITQSLSQFNDTIFLQPGGSSANIATMPLLTDLADRTARLTTTGLNITTIDGDLLVNNGFIQTDTINVSTINYQTLNPAIVVANPAYVYYVAMNGRLKSAGATGTINDPFSLIADALTMPSENPRGMVIYVAPGEYNESFTITISNTLRAVSVIGLSDDTRDSKRACINGTISIVGTVVGHTNTINTVVLNNLRVSAPAPTTNAVFVSGVGIRVSLKNGLYSSAYNAPIFGFNDAVIQVYNTGTTKTNRVQLSIDNCSITNTGTNVPLTYIWGNAQVIQIINSDFSNNGGGYALYANQGNITTVSQCGFSTTGKTAVHLLPGLVSNEDPAVDNVSNFNNCYFSSQPDNLNPIIAVNNGFKGATVVVTTANISLSTIFNNGTETLGVPSTSEYIDINTAGVVVIQNSQIITKNKPTTITPYKTNNAPGSGLYYFGNTYISGNIAVGLVLPVGWGLGVIKLTTEP